MVKKIFSKPGSAGRKEGTFSDIPLLGKVGSNPPDGKRLNPTRLLAPGDPIIDKKPKEFKEFKRSLPASEGFGGRMPREPLQLLSTGLPLVVAML